MVSRYGRKEPAFPRSKLQAPSSREAPRSKFQKAAGERSGRFGAWGLGFLWSLVLGAWSFPVSAQTLNLPARLTNAADGTEFAARIAPLDLASRESEIASQILAGNVPNFLRNLCP